MIKAHARDAFVALMERSRSIAWWCCSSITLFVGDIAIITSSCICFLRFEFAFAPPPEPPLLRDPRLISPCPSELPSSRIMLNDWSAISVTMLMPITLCILSFEWFELTGKDDRRVLPPAEAPAPVGGRSRVVEEEEERVVLWSPFVPLVNETSLSVNPL